MNGNMSLNVQITAIIEAQSQYSVYYPAYSVLLIQALKLEFDYLL